ncbi:phage tail protein [Seminibacterium arietis]|uniref:Phage tail protein n=1 Tax=Seminibacterium arietis TaxID=1173502 RepID=A0ABW3I930_9PAST
MFNLRKYLYQRLTAFIAEQLPSRYKNNLYSWIEDGEIIDEGQQLTEQGEVLAFLKYNAVIWLEQFPFKQIDPAVIKVNLLHWLKQNDPYRYRVESAVNFDIEMLDDNTADLVFNVQCFEPMEAVEDENGNIYANGKKYRLDYINIYTAEEIATEISIDTSEHSI